ncbi:hypothetical protein SDC9_170738 [bioreactor metagenome]|uniref:Uncharacterized protein n=1 Tax=bioreactor metagenome TaxID=1076179 RepID=A0A645GBC6_9ZZZZ
MRQATAEVKAQQRSVKLAVTQLRVKITGATMR